MTEDLIGQRVSVHLNLTRGDYVIALKPKSKVLAYAASVILTDVTFKVSEAQRQYCIARNGRWVHAFALGTLENVGTTFDTGGLLRITYNPFRAPTFHVHNQEWPVYGARRVVFTGRYCYASEEDIR